MTHIRNDMMSHMKMRSRRDEGKTGMKRCLASTLRASFPPTRNTTVLPTRGLDASVSSPLMFASQPSITPCSRMSTRNSITASRAYSAGPTWGAVRHGYLGFVSCYGRGLRYSDRPSKRSCRLCVEETLKQQHSTKVTISEMDEEIFLTCLSSILNLFPLFLWNGLAQYSLAHVLHTAYPLLRTASSRQK
jgi:hypothetical protein